MKKIMFILLLLTLPVCIAQNFQVWAERGGPFTIGKPEKVLIYVKNNGLKEDSYAISVREVSARYRNVDVSHLLKVELLSAKIVNVMPNETKLTEGKIIILGPIDIGHVVFRVYNLTNHYVDVRLENIRATYPQSLFEFNTTYVIFLLIFSSLILLKNKIFLILLIIPVAKAGYISITTNADTPIAYSDEVYAQITITNSGDEPARDVSFSIFSDYFSSQQTYIGKINPMQTIQKNITITLQKNIKEGKYIGSLITNYKDLNGYPFSAITPIEVIYKKFLPSKVSVIGKNIKLPENGKAKIPIKLKNNDYKLHKINVTLYLPNELNTPKNKFELELEPNSEKNIFLQVSTFSAVKGSNYVYFVSVDYEDKYHYSEYFLGYIEIVGKNKIKLAYIFAGLALIISLIFLFSKRKQK